MFRVLRDIDSYFVRELFKRNFHTSEEVYFKKAWKERTREHSFGLWNDDMLIGITIVCDTKLEYICIEPSEQGNGWGSKLLQYLLSVCPTLYLHPADDIELCKWYERQGFQLSNEIRYPLYMKRCYVHHTYPTRSKRKLL